MLEGRGVHDHARCKGRREPPLINGEVCSERQRNEADHFTGSCGARINPSERPGCLVGNMVINQDAWRRGWEGNDQFTDAAGPLRIGAIDEHDRIRLPGGRLKSNLSNGWDYVVHGWRSVGANYGYLSAKLPENRL